MCKEKCYHPPDRYETDLYFEAHITLEPIDSPGIRAKVIKFAELLEFRMATFLLKKDDTTPDDFLSARNSSYEMLHDRMMLVVEWLLDSGIIVKRYKIENTLLDVKL